VRFLLKGDRRLLVKRGSWEASVAEATKEFIDASGRRKVKGNMDIELAVWSDNVCHRYQ